MTTIHKLIHVIVGVCICIAQGQAATLKEMNHRTPEKVVQHHVDMQEGDDFDDDDFDDVYEDYWDESDDYWEVKRSIECMDLRRECVQWRKEGRDCTTDRYMRAHCPTTCRSCQEIVHLGPPMSPAYYRSDRGNSRMIMTALGGVMGLPQVSPDAFMVPDLIARVEEDKVYYQEEVLTEVRYVKVRDTCKNKHYLCTYWALQGQCEDSEKEEFMLKACPVACHWCHELHVDAKCYWDPMKTRNAWYDGDCHAMFERIVSLGQYNVTVLSRPKEGKDEEEKHGDTIPDGPWIITIDDFLSSKEADRLIVLGHEMGYERSTDIGDEIDVGVYEGVVSSGRTSVNSWCYDKCAEDPLVIQVFERLNNLTHIPLNNSESLQLLKYEEGQLYSEHHDYAWYEYDKIGGPRILTVFMYLNDVEEGGSTRFTKLDLSVTPKKGRALLWPSVLNEDPHAVDERTNHEALPVIRGVKYGANAWYHQRNFEEAASLGC
jgi:prolyl 4-hydroxylase